MQSPLKERTPMLGKRNPQEPLFYYFNMADMIPKNHILRLINKYVDFSFIRSKVKHLYSVLTLKYLSACSLLGSLWHHFREAIQRVANFSNYAIKWFRFIIFQKQSCLLQGRSADNILLLLAHEWI